MGYPLFSACVSLFMLYQIFTTAGSVWLSYWSDNTLPFVDNDDNEAAAMNNATMDQRIGEEGGGGNGTNIDGYLARRYENGTRYTLGEVDF
jgi:hypothetical protein